jgi:hypothetical protein
VLPSPGRNWHTKPHRCRCGIRSVSLGVATRPDSFLSWRNALLLPMCSTADTCRPEPRSTSTCRDTWPARATATTPSSTKEPTRSPDANDAAGTPPAPTAPTPNGSPPTWHSAVTTTATNGHRSPSPSISPSAGCHRRSSPFGPAPTTPTDATSTSTSHRRSAECRYVGSGPITSNGYTPSSPTTAAPTAQAASTQRQSSRST